MFTHHIKLALQLTAALGLSAIGLSAHAANPIGCQAKGALYILENGKQTLLAVTPGAGTTAAASNQGHAGFQTDATGKFTLSYPTTPLTPTQTYYFRMEVHNSQFLAYGISGLYGNTFKTMAQPVTGQVLCDGPTPSQAAGVNLGAVLPPPAAVKDCADPSINVGQLCAQWFKFSPSYHAAPGYEAALRTSYASVPDCKNPYLPNDPPSNLVPSTTASGPTSGCMRRFWVNRMAAPNPASKWIPILNLSSWQIAPTTQNLVVGEQLAN